jgi:elongation factor P
MEAGKLRPGNVFRMDGRTYQVLDYEYVQNDRRRFTRVRFKDLNNGVIQEQRFNCDEFLEDAHVAYRELEFSYNVDELYTFMDTSTYDQIDVNFAMVKDAMKWNAEGTIYLFTFLDDKIIAVAPPTFVVQAVVETEPSVAGDTARNAMKNAVVESGISVKVPMFVNNGDRIKIDTRTGTYVERAN